MLKEIEILNYKSFLHEKISKISPRINLILGKNGQGKSNFYSALKFIFKIEEKNVVSENEKRGLLNEKLSNQNLYVKIILKNEKQIFPIDKKEFSLKKEIDKENKIFYYLNDIVINKDHFRNILDCGGISKFFSLKFISSKNITKIANLNGMEIYQILKDLTGAKIYEEKKIESCSILEKTTFEEKRAESLLEDLQEKLILLESNKNKFLDYEKKTKEIDSIKFLLYKRKLKDLKEKFETVQEKSKLHDKKIEKKQFEISELNDFLEKTDIDFKLLEQKKIKNENVDDILLLDDLFQPSIFGTDFENHENKCNEKLFNFKENNEVIEKNIYDIEDNEEKLKRLKNEQSLILAEKNDILKQIELKQTSSNMKNIKERDFTKKNVSFTNIKIEELSSSIKNSETEINNKEKEINNLKKDVKTLEKKKSEISEKLEVNLIEVNTHNKKIKRLYQKKKNLLNEKNYSEGEINIYKSSLEKKKKKII